MFGTSYEIHIDQVLMRFFISCISCAERNAHKSIFAEYIAEYSQRMVIEGGEMDIDMAYVNTRDDICYLAGIVGWKKTIYLRKCGKEY